MKCDLHSLKLVQNLASLFDVNVKNKFSDVTVQVGDRCFYVHKLVLQLNSDYFANLSYANGTETLNNINPDRFYDVLQFMYTGEIQLSDESVESVLSTADVLRMIHLKQVCFRYMDDNLTVENALRYLLLGDKCKQTALVQKCQVLIKTNWTKFYSCTSLIHSTEEMSWFLDAGELNMSNEVEVCEMLIKWLKRQDESGKDVSHSNELLTLIRWSSIGVDYLKSSLLNNAVLTSNASSRMFLGKVLTYLLSGVQFPGLKTFHRSATGLESCLFVIGLDSNDEKAVSNNVYRISLQRPNRTPLLGGIPAEMLIESACCSIGNAVFLTGVGSARQDQLWRWELLSGWTRCADMIEDRRRHSVVMVDSILFVLGGFNGSTNTVLCSVDSYSALANKWKPVGELIHAVESAASVMYKNSIYVFGGFQSNGRPSDFVQVYNIASNRCIVMRTPMPRAGSLMRALMWETSVILLKRDACYIYNLETDSWRERNQFRTNVMYFAAVLDNERIYVAGGGVSSCSSSNGENNWVETDEVKSVSVLDLVNDKLATWEFHAKLACPSSIHSYSLITMPSLVEDFDSLILRKRRRLARTPTFSTKYPRLLSQKILRRHASGRTVYVKKSKQQHDVTISSEDNNSGVASVPHSTQTNSQQQCPETNSQQRSPETNSQQLQSPETNSQQQSLETKQRRQVKSSHSVLGIATVDHVSVNIEGVKNQPPADDYLQSVIAVGNLQLQPSADDVQPHPNANVQPKSSPGGTVQYTRYGRDLKKIPEVNSNKLTRSSDDIKDEPPSSNDEDEEEKQEDVGSSCGVNSKERQEMKKSILDYFNSLTEKQAKAAMVTDELLERISKILNLESFNEFAALVQFTKKDIAGWKRKGKGDVCQMALQMLKTWKEINAKNATILEIRLCLREIGLLKAA